MDKERDPYGCRGWHNRVSDWFTNWKGTHAHRSAGCRAPANIVCPCCDSPEELERFQKGLRQQIAIDEARIKADKALLDLHEAKWGVLK